MNLQDLLPSYFLAIGMSILWRLIKPMPGQTRMFLLFSTLSGSAVGVFAGLMVGGAWIQDKAWWLYLACPLIAAVLTVRMQAMVGEWTESRK